MKMTIKTMVLVVTILSLLFISGCGSPLKEVSITLKEDFGKRVAFVDSNNTIVFEAIFDEPYFGERFNISIDLEKCYEITCDCAKNTSTPCMMYCMRCEE